MATDAERWRFLADNSLILNRDPKQGCSVMYYEKPANPGAPPKFRSVATGKTPDEAIDNAIKRWEKKHGRRYQIEGVIGAAPLQSSPPGPEEATGEVRRPGRK